jgi:hypothetical protein
MISAGNSYNTSNSNSFKLNNDGRDLPLWFRMAMPVPVTLVSGI